MSGWYATHEGQASAMAAWASRQGLRYERYGVLPTVSELLERGVSEVERATAAKELTGLDFVSFAGQKPGRWAENICTGVLPGGLEGTLAHFSYQVRQSEHWYTKSTTVAILVGTSTRIVLPNLGGLVTVRSGKLIWAEPVTRLTGPIKVTRAVK